VLAVCATPIGNLDDVTLRVLRELREADVVLCEDTRHTRRLLDAHGISARTLSYHEHNEAARTAALVPRLLAGERVALVSDAGMPAISDPGYRLIRACIDRDLDLEVLPGPSSILTALVASGLPTHRFRFYGFLPRRTGELERVLQSTETLIAFESPRRLPESLRALAQLAPDRPAAV
jgi:16S rRNA (cytidine1402-2'-O)-methyltransferase